jgi:hypothetical protein
MILAAHGALRATIGLAAMGYAILGHGRREA